MRNMRRPMQRHFAIAALVLCLISQLSLWAQTGRSTVSGIVLDEKNLAVAGTTVVASSASGEVRTTTDGEGHFSLSAPAGSITLRVIGRYITSEEKILDSGSARENLEIRIHYSIPPLRDSMVITATALDPTIDRRNHAVY